MNKPHRPPLLVLLAVIVFAECALMAAAVVYLVVELLIDEPASFASAVALTVLVSIAAVWLAVIGVNTLRAASWIRGAIITWQVLQIAVAIGAFQGFYARPDIGWALLIPAIAAVLLLFTRPVMQATTRDVAAPED